MSLRSRLLFTLSIALIAMWAIVGWMSYDKTSHEVDEMLDGQLALSVRLIEAQLDHLAEHPADPVHALRQAGAPINETLYRDQPRLHPYEPTIEFEVRNSAGQQVLRSEQAMQMVRQATLGYVDLPLGDRPWRSLTAQSRDGRWRIQVAQPADARHKIGLEVAQHVALPMILSLPAMLLVLFWSVNGVLTPLAKLRKEIAGRSGDQLAPVSTDGVFAEVRPVIDSLNQLLARVEHSIQNERQLTANAAHELRTPLAALKVHAQIAAATPDEAQRRRSMDQVLRGIKRSERLVSQMLRLARLESEQLCLQQESIDLHALLLECKDMVTSLAESQAQTILIDVDPAIGFITGDRDLWLVALKNLLENALRYGPADSQVVLGSRWQDGVANLFVRDAGNGVSEEELVTLTQRFKRGANVASEGAGLGLAIVDRIAKLQGATLTLSNAPGSGFLAELLVVALSHGPRNED